MSPSPSLHWHVQCSLLAALCGQNLLWEGTLREWPAGILARAGRQKGSGQALTQPPLQRSAELLFRWQAVGPKPARRLPGACQCWPLPISPARAEHHQQVLIMHGSFSQSADTGDSHTLNQSPELTLVGIRRDRLEPNSYICLT